MQCKYANLFEPIKIGKLEIKNRFALAPMGPGGLCSEDGAYNERGIEYYVERARGGTGLIMTGVTLVGYELEKCSLPCPTLNPGQFIRTGKVMTERSHAYDAKIFVQLTAGFGRVSIPSIAGNSPVAPSRIPHRWVPGLMCRELTVDEIKTFIRRFAESAEIVKAAGFDGVEIHAVHEGYLLDQFAIAFFNHRTDEYGGSLENRLRFATDIVKAIKERCGADFPVSLRYSIKSFIKDWCQGGLPGEEFEEKGRDIEEGIAAAKILEAAGYDAFNGDVGSYDSWYWSHPPMYQKKGLYLPYNSSLKQHVKVPVITAGRMDNPELASAAIADGKTDMIGLGRPLLADPELPNKILAGRTDKIRPCLSCQEGCMGRLAKFTLLSCAVNPTCGREREYDILPARVKKNVLVIGGGIAGMEAARVCALRGHDVTLCEKSDRLGGNLVPGGVPDFKEDDRQLIAWYQGELRDLAVTVQLGRELTAADVKQAAADAVIVATGSTPKMLRLGAAGNVYTAEDVLMGRRDPGGRTIIVGAGLVGCETALWLHEQGKKVVIVEQAADILQCGGPLCHANEDMLRALLVQKKITVKTGATVTGAANGGFTVTTAAGVETVAADSVVVAIGYNPQRSLYDELRHEIPGLQLLGDARQVQNIMYAIWDAYEVARNI